MPEVDQKDLNNNDWRSRVRPFLAGLSSALVVLLAFLIPSLQDVWDRHETRQAVERYVEIGQRLSKHGKYTAAEEAFGRALELGGNQRHDLLELKMLARVQRIGEDAEWPGAVPEGLTESDFLYLLETQSTPERAQDRAATLTAYATFLAINKRWTEAEKTLLEATTLDPAAAQPLVSLGNLRSDLGNINAAEAAYRKALQLQRDNANAHYNLGLLLLETNRAALAEEQFQLYAQLRPNDLLGRHRLAECLLAQGKASAARTVYQEILRLNPADTEARDAFNGLPR